MREIRTSGSEGGGAGNSTGSPYPYKSVRPARPYFLQRHAAEIGVELCSKNAAMLAPSISLPAGDGSESAASPSGPPAASAASQ